MGKFRDTATEETNRQRQRQTLGEKDRKEPLIWKKRS